MAGFRDLSVRMQILALGLLSAALGFALEYTLLQPLGTANQALAGQVASLEATNEHLRPLVGKVAQLRDLNQQLEVKWQTVEARLPILRSSNEFLEQLQQIAVASEIRIRKVAANASQSKPLYQEAPYALEVDGSYPNVLNFFDQLAHMSRIVSVTHWTMTGLHSGAAGADSYRYDPGETLTTDCDISAFYSPLATGAAAAAPVKGKTK